MSQNDDDDIPDDGPREDAAPPERENDAPRSARTMRPVMMVACLAATLALVGLVAVLRPAGLEEPKPDEEAPPSEEILIDIAAPIENLVSAEAPRKWPASRPVAGARVAALIRADAAFDAGDFTAARELYLDLLLTGGDLGGPDGDTVVRWAHGRLALALARIARAAGAPALIDEPALAFRGGLK